MVTTTGMHATHRGWFWFCPVYLAFAPDCDGFDMEERRAWLAPVFCICMQLEQLRIFLTSILVPWYEPTFGVIVTGELPARS